MHKIYFEKRSIAICTEQEEALADPNSIEFHLGNAQDIHSLISMIENSSTLDRIYIPTDNFEETYRKICNEFTEVIAAGGLVSNKRGDYLMIKRDGLWDLPKGHREKDEPTEQTAVREVTEETGIDDLLIRKLICVTDHCYFRRGTWFLKHTWWYDMLYDKPEELIPQIEEDITKAAWIAKSSVAHFLQNTYPSIVEVFRESKL